MKSLSESRIGKRLSRRDWLKTGGVLGLAGLGGIPAVLANRSGNEPIGLRTEPDSGLDASSSPHARHVGPKTGAMHTVGTVDHAANGFDPMEMLTDFDYGEVSTLPDGRILREYTIIAQDKEIEIAPGMFFPAWTYNGRVPGPTIRCIEGELLRVHFRNAGSHPHTIHFHGMHQASMDGVPGAGAGMIEAGQSTVYEFSARPFGCHFYHCHAIPLKRHVHKGLYGAFIIDPDPSKYSGVQKELAKRRNHQYDECNAIHEMVMVMNGFDTNFDGDNEVYAANSIAFAYQNSQIQIRSDQKQRIYLVNATEFDPINSFHLHGNFFDYYDHGTTLEPTLRMIDTVMQCQGQRGVLEFSYEGYNPGSFMFHAHQSEFAELGWMGFFDVQDGENQIASESRSSDEVS